jgi:hypothetical protein
VGYLVQIASGNEGGIAAVIVAIATLIGAVFTGIFKFLQSYDGRTDKATASSLSTMASARDDAIVGEERMRLERDEARRETLTANRRADRWMEGAQAAELELARRPIEGDQ